MARVYYNGQSFEVSNRANGRDMRRTLGLSSDEIPARVGNDGNLEPVNDNREYFIEDESRFDKVNRLRNG